MRHFPCSIRVSTRDLFRSISPQLQSQLETSPSDTLTIRSFTSALRNFTSVMNRKERRNVISLCAPTLHRALRGCSCFHTVLSLNEVIWIAGGAEEHNSDLHNSASSPAASSLIQDAAQRLDALFTDSQSGPSDVHVKNCVELAAVALPLSTCTPRRLGTEFITQNIQRISNSEHAAWMLTRCSLSPDRLSAMPVNDLVETILRAPHAAASSDVVFPSRFTSAIALSAAKNTLDRGSFIPLLTEKMVLAKTVVPAKRTLDVVRGLCLLDIAASTPKIGNLAVSNIVQLAFGGFNLVPLLLMQQQRRSCDTRFPIANEEQKEFDDFGRLLVDHVVGKYVLSATELSEKVFWAVARCTFPLVLTLPTVDESIFEHLTGVIKHAATKGFACELPSDLHVLTSCADAVHQSSAVATASGPFLEALREFSRPLASAIATPLFARTVDEDTLAGLFALSLREGSIVRSYRSVLEALLGEYVDIIGPVPVHHLIGHCEAMGPALREKVQCRADETCRMGILPS